MPGRSTRAAGKPEDSIPAGTAPKGPKKKLPENERLRKELNENPPRDFESFTPPSPTQVWGGRKYQPVRVWGLVVLFNPPCLGYVVMGGNPGTGLSA